MFERWKKRLELPAFALTLARSIEWVWSKIDPSIFSAIVAGAGLLVVSMITLVQDVPPGTLAGLGLGSGLILFGLGRLAAIHLLPRFTGSKPIGQPVMGTKASKSAIYLPHGGVLWADTGRNYAFGGGVIAEGPMCPVDYADLRYVGRDTEHSGPRVVQNEDFVNRYAGHLWCPECDANYLLDGYPKVGAARGAVEGRFEGLRRKVT